MQSLADWLDRRFNYRVVGHHLRNRVLPDGPSWIYTSASCLLWLLVIQCVTGLFLMTTYCPSMTSAWASVHYIDQAAAGRFIRGIHHYASHAMIILFGVHVARVTLYGAYRAPREFVWITGLLLFPLVIVWTVTGNPLTVSQKGISQIQVEGNILGSTPFVGPYLRRLLFGGDEVGNLTLTRLYALHVGLLPLAVGGLCLVHLYQVVKHSKYRLDASQDSPDMSTATTYWPYQSVRNMIALVAVVGVLSVVSWLYGAPLAAPADPDLTYSPRPEWYFRWLFELRRYFTGDNEYIATMVIPSGLLFGLMAVPFLDRYGSIRLNHIGRIVIVVASLGGWGLMTGLSYREDFGDAQYLAEQAEFEKLSTRALALAKTEPISEKGAIQLLRLDPQTQGPRLFARHCLSCHSHVDEKGEGLKASESSAPNLDGLGTAAWIGGFLDPQQIVSNDYFGQTKFRDGEMVQHVRELSSETSPEATANAKETRRLIAVALAAEAGIEACDASAVARGRELLVSSGGCTNCHRFHEQGELGSAPDLTGYLSVEWLTQMISRPTHERFYHERNDRMPEFASDPAHPELNLLSSQELDLLIRWLRSDDSSLRKDK